MRKEGHFEKNISRTGKWLVIAVCVLLALVLGLAVFANHYVNDMMGEVNHVEVSGIDRSQAPTVAETENPAEAEAAAFSEPAEPAETKVQYNPEDFINMLIVCKPAYEDGTVLTKTMVLCTLNTRSKLLTMTALEADAYVTAPEYKGHAPRQMKLSAVYNIGAGYGNGKAGSMEYINQTLYNNFGIEVDHNFEIDFQFFAKVVNRLKYVDMELSQEEAKYLTEKTGTGINAGKIQMNGALAAEYVRMWDNEEASGVSGISGQRKMVEAIVRKIRTEYIADLDTIVRDMLPLITTSMNETQMKEFVVSMLPMVRNLVIEKGEPCPVDCRRETVDVDGKETDVLIFDTAKTIRAMQALTEGKE